VVAFIEKLDLKEVILVGESIGAVLAMTVAGTIPERISKVVASNTYDYDTRYGDGVRRGNFFANFIIGIYAIPILGTIFAALENWLFLALQCAVGYGTSTGCQCTADGVQSCRSPKRLSLCRTQRLSQLAIMGKGKDSLFCSESTRKVDLWGS